MSLKDRQRRFSIWFVPVLMLLAALYIIGWAYLESPTHRHYNPASTNGADHTNEQPTRVSQPSPDVNPDTETKEETNQKDEGSIKRSDLAAQWAMAHYTFVGLIAGLVGIGFIIWTIIETRGAAYFAEQALQETKINSRRELRAYLSVEVIAKNLTETNGTPTINIRIKNNGSSPAINISYHVRGFGADEYTEWNVTVPPNSSEEIEWPLEALDVSETADAEYFRFKLAYSDIFNGDRWIHCKCYIASDNFPRTQDVEVRTPDAYSIAAYGDTSTHVIVNPSHVRERKAQFSFYRDDLQEEAKEYAEANKPA